MSTTGVSTDTSFRAEVEAVISEYFEQRLVHTEKIGTDYRKLWNEMQALMNSGGKRIRSRIMLLAYRMYGGTDINEVIPIAAAHEMLHMAMLIHDDIIDRDYVRYGVKNIAGTYLDIYDTKVQSADDRLHFAHSSALLAGDLLLSDTYRMIAKAGISAEKIVEIQDIFSDGIFEVIGGELLDTESVFSNHQPASSEKIALHKTASYTFVLPMMVGASLAGASVDQKLTLTEFAKNLGVAFQLRDDILGVFGDKNKTGKTNTGDIAEGKRTYMVEQFFELSDETQKQQFASIYGKHEVSSADADSIRTLLTDTGSLAATERAIDEYVENAHSYLELLDIAPTYANELRNIVTLATNRSR